MEDLRKLTIGELTALVQTYPWFGAARVEICRRTAQGADAAFCEAAIYASSRRELYEMMYKRDRSDFVDGAAAIAIKEAPKKAVRVSGADFFSQSEYDSVRQEGDDVFASFVRNVRSEKSEEIADETLLSFCTETLAQIYAEQGYPDQAKYIYSKLSLRYPEKNAYFAALIEKLDSIANN